LGLKIRLGTEKCEDEGEGMGNGGGGKFLVNKGGMHGRLGRDMELYWKRKERWFGEYIGFGLVGIWIWVGLDWILIGV